MKVGDRIELIFTDDKWTDLRPGDQGTVTMVNDLSPLMGGSQIGVDWDNGSRLMMVPPRDRIRVIKEEVPS